VARAQAAVLLVLSGLVGGGCATSLAISLMGSQRWHTELTDMMSRQEPSSSAASRLSPMPPAREGSGEASVDALAAAATDSIGPAGLAVKSDAVVEATETPRSAAAAQPTAPSLASDEIAMLTRRAETYITDGDFVSARLLLQHAAAARDARAALILAATYDPDGLRRLGLRAKAGLTLDIAMAKTWYERAVNYGSADASELSFVARNSPAGLDFQTLTQSLQAHASSMPGRCGETREQPRGGPKSSARHGHLLSHDAFA
jgi:hypothetical protein